MARQDRYGYGNRGKKIYRPVIKKSTPSQAIVNSPRPVTQPADDKFGYQPYDFWDYVLSGVGFISEGGYTFFTMFAAATYLLAIQDYFNLSSSFGIFLNVMSPLSSIVDSIVSWLMMANMPAAAKEFKEECAKLWKNLKNRKGWYQVYAPILALAVLLTFCFGAVVPATGLAEYDPIEDSEYRDWYMVILGSIFTAGQMFCYLFTAVDALFSLPNTIWEYFNPQEAKEERASRGEQDPNPNIKTFGQVGHFWKLVFIVLTLLNVANRSWGFKGSFELLRERIETFYGKQRNPNWLQFFSYLALVCSAIQTYASQSSKNLKWITGNTSGRTVPAVKIKSNVMGYFLQGVKYITMFLVWFSRAFSGPERLVAKQADQYNGKDLGVGFVGLILSGLAATQYVYWSMHYALQGLHYLADRTKCFGGTVLTELEGYDDVEVDQEEKINSSNTNGHVFNPTFVIMTPETASSTSDSTSSTGGKSPVPQSPSAYGVDRNQVEVPGELEEVTEAKQGCCAYVTQMLTTCFGLFAKNEASVGDEEKATESELDASAGNKRGGRCPSIWAAISTCCGLKKQDVTFNASLQAPSLTDPLLPEAPEEEKQKCCPSIGKALSNCLSVFSGSRPRTGSVSSYAPIGEDQGCCARVFGSSSAVTV